MLRDQKGVAVATQTKTGTAMKTLLAVTVVVAAISAISAFGLVAVSGLKGLLAPISGPNCMNETCLSINHLDYVIITRPMFRSSLNSFINYKKTQNLSVGILTAEYIKSLDSWNDHTS